MDPQSAKKGRWLRRRDKIQDEWNARNHNKTKLWAQLSIHRILSYRLFPY